MSVLAWMLPHVSLGQVFETGIAGGYDFGVPLAFERDPARISWCSGTGKGTSSNHAFWLGVFAHLPSFFSAGLGGLARLNAEYSSGKFRSEQYMTTPFYDPVGNRVISALARFDARADFFSLRGDALLTAALTEYVTAEIGPWVRYRPGGRFVQTESILAPDDAVFSETGRRERALAEGERIAGPRWNGGVFAALRFTSPLGSGLDLQWDMHTFLDVRALTLNVGPRSFSIGIGLTLAFPMHCERRESPEPPPPIVPSPLETAERKPEREPVEASISLFSTGPNGERIRFALVQSTQHYHRLNVPLLPIVFFERHSSQIPGRYVQLSRSARFSFSPRRLIRRNTIEIYRNVLNIIGLRLSEDPSAVLTITGMTSTDEPVSLAVARAEAVFMYLRSVWDIPASRLRISSKPVTTPRDGPPAQQRAVMLSSSSPAVTAPVVIDWMEESFRSTPINLDPSIRNPEAVRDWTISIMHQDREIARTTRAETGQDLELDIGLLLENAEGSGKVPPIIARFSVEDSSGTVTTATDALDIVFSGDSAGSTDGIDVRTTTTHVLRGSDFTLSPQGRLNRDIIRELAMRLRDGDQAVIRPVLDMTGGSLVAEEDISREVQHVANALLIALEGKNVRITIERGIPLPPRERDLPETAVLSRLIAVTIEHVLEPQVRR